MKLPKTPPGHRDDEYLVHYRCTNCDWYDGFWIKKGKPAPKKSKEPCPNCGCRTLVKA